MSCTRSAKSVLTWLGGGLAATTLAAAPVLAQESVPAPAVPASASSPVTLETVVISGSGGNAVRPTQRSEAGKTVISGAELRSVPGSNGDPMKGLQALPGVTSASDTSGEPAIRGTGPNDNTYRVDGLPTGYLFHVGGLVSTLPADLVKRFELYTAAWGPEFDDVIGAALDVTLRNPRTDRIGGNVNVSFYGADALIEGPVAEGQSFYLAARRSYLDLLIRRIEDSKSGVTLALPRYADFQGKYLWQVNEADRLTLSVTGAADDLSFEVAGGSRLGTQEPVLVGTSAIRLDTGTQALVWERLGEGGARNTLALGHTLTRQRSHFASAGRVGVEVDNVFMREAFTFEPTDRHEVTLGATLEQVNIGLDLDFNAARCTSFDPNCDLTSAPRQQVQDSIPVRGVALHAQDRWKLAPDWTLNSGLRYSTDNYLGRSHLEPRLGLSWQATPRTRYSLGWGLHHQMPAGQEITRDIGNPHLAQIRARHSVAGVAQQLDGGWSWTLEAYHKRFDDFVVADPLQNYINGASGSARGLELLLRKDPAGSAFSGWMALSLSNSERRNDVTGANFPFEFDQPVILTLVGTWKRSDDWQLGAKWTMHSGSPITPVVGTGTYPDGRVRPIYGEVNSERLPFYHRLDLRLDRTLSPTFKLFFELINAYNQANLSGYNYSADYSSREPAYQLPRIISVGLGWNF